ncbi:MAG: DUF167 domain-containing protein [Candidatus Aminicenantes bacterium]|nr:DUF167 domain-containing protein [Candidatus Aminicenantes bacterium]
MKIFVKVKPRAKENRIEQTDKNQFSVWVQARPEKGQANRAVIEILAEYFGLSKSRVMLLKGQTAKQKTFEIRDTL